MSTRATATSRLPLPLPLPQPKPRTLKPKPKPKPEPNLVPHQDWRRRIAAETSAFTRCLRCFLRGPEDEQNLRAELKNLGFNADEVGF